MSEPLYSQGGTRPAPLPFRIVLPSGFTRTDPTSFSPEEIAAAGLVGPFEEPAYDATTQQVQWVDGAYVVKALPPPPPPPPPPPDWLSFKRLALTHPGLNQAIAAALPLAPAAALALPAALMRAEQGAVADFAGCWRAVVAAANSAPELVAELIAAAQAANLPAEVVEALEPSAPELTRARDEFGRFIPDDPATPEDEAWVPAE